MARVIKYEPPHDKTNKMACAPTENSDQSSLISLYCPHEETIERTVKTLIAGRKSHCIGFAMLWLICLYSYWKSASSAVHNLHFHITKAVDTQHNLLLC